MKRRLLTIAGVIVALALLAGVLLLNQPKPTAAYATAAASLGDITERVTLSGRVQRDGTETLTFATPATVTEVLVKVGDQVKPDQPLARIDDTALRADLLKAEASLAQARAAYAAGEKARKAAKNPPKPPQPLSMTQLTGAMVGLKKAASRQQAVCKPVMDALGDLPADLPASLPTALPTSLPTAVPVDGSARPRLPGVTPTAVPTALPSRLPTALPSTLPSGVPTAHPSGVPSSLPTLPPTLVPALRNLQPCLDAVTDLAAAQQRAGAAMAQAGQQLNKSAAEMQKLAAQAAQQAASAGGMTTKEADQARIVAAQQQVDRAQKNLAQATLRAERTATVGASTFVAGEASAGKSLTLVASGGVTVTVQAPLYARPFLKPGLPATVTLLGTNNRLPGTIGEVGVLPPAGGSTTYPTTIELDDPGFALPSGATVDVSLDYRTAQGAVVVPVSAITKTSRDAGTVQTVASPDAQEARTVTIGVGAVGGGMAEVTSGLTAGDLVVLADRRLPVPGGMAQYRQNMSPHPSASAPTPETTP